MQISAEFSAGPPTGPDELPVATEPAAAECVPAGNGHWVGSNIADYSLTNCNGDVVNLHDNCASYKSMWLIATAGWCTACTAYIADLKSTWGTSQLTHQDVPEGTRLWVILAEDAGQNKPTQSYCNQYAQQKGIDPAMLLMDWADAQVQVPLAYPEGQAIVTNSLGSTWAKVNPYLTADASGSVMSAYPWNAVLRGSNMEYVFCDFFDQTKYAPIVVQGLNAE
jgi:hypothetical protein